MIGFLGGEIIEKRDGKLLVLTQSGVGYLVSVPTSVLANNQKGQKISLYTYLKVGEQILDLYGFASKQEESLFQLVISVSGIGPRSGLAIISSGTPEQVQAAISSGNISFFTAISGIGKRTAERIMVELKEKVGIVNAGVVFGNSNVNKPLQEAIDGLKAMGYTNIEVQEMLQGVETDGLQVHEILKSALQKK